MWLLKFHFAFSILCALATCGMSIIFRKEINANGWFSDTEKAQGVIARIAGFLKCVAIHIVPIVNVAMPVIVLYMVGAKRRGGADNGDAET